MTVFDDSFAFTVGVEGGLTDDPSDPGGLTNWGISQRSYPNLDIASLTIADAKAIYRRDFWNNFRGDDLPPQLAFLTFDAAVNNGLGRGAVWLQRAIGTVEDGQVGPATIAAARASVGHDPFAAAIEIVAQRTFFMGGLGLWPHDGLGWSRRLASLPYEAVKLSQRFA